jgi:hypothetical protein
LRELRTRRKVATRRGSGTPGLRETLRGGRPVMAEERGFRKGAEEFQKAVETAASRGGGFTDTEWFRWKDNETKIIRFLSDAKDLYTTVMHEGVLSADGRRRSFVCRKENPKSPEGTTCELCALFEVSKAANPDDTSKWQANPREKVWGLAVLRVEHRDDQNKLDGYMDFVVTDEKTGKPKPVVGILRQAVKNFWNQPYAYYQRYGTLRDRDYEIKRTGGMSLDTQYITVPCDALEIANIEERYAKFTPDIEAVLTRMSSQEYYDKHLRGASEQSSDAPQPNGQQAAAQAQPPIPGDGTEFERLQREREALTAAAVSGTYE